ncbi:MAG TPA: hypothetical protein VIJ62_08295, partial [Rhizomicrobium sp.]
MSRQSVPDDQQLPANLLGQRVQELDELRTSDRASMESEIESLYASHNVGDERAFAGAASVE